MSAQEATLAFKSPSPGLIDDEKLGCNDGVRSLPVDGDGLFLGGVGLNLLGLSLRGA